MIDQPLRHDRSSRSRSLLRRHCGLLLLLAILLPLRLERARLESSIWIDETYSFLLAQKPVLKIFDFLTVDPNPPGYFLALKAWLEAVRMVAGEPGVLAARLLSCLGWVLLAAISWFGGERLLGRRGGALLAASVSGSGYAALFAKDARGYSLASVSLFACFVALSLLYCGREEGSGRPGLLWAFYAAAAEVALWTHALSGIAILFLFIFWLASLRGAKRRAPGYLAGGATAHLAIVFLFLPWVIHLARQSSYYMQAIQGFANPSFSSFQKVVSIDAATRPTATISGTRRRTIGATRASTSSRPRAARAFRTSPSRLGDFGAASPTTSTGATRPRPRALATASPWVSQR